MTSANSVILCLVYILGLLSTAVPWGGCGILALGIGAAILSQRRFATTGWARQTELLKFWQIGPTPKLWLIAGLIGLLATFYLQVRVPQPGARDISWSVSASTVTAQPQVVTVLGKVDSMPRLTRSQRIQFWLKATQLSEVRVDQPAGLGKSVTGKLYVTVPSQPATKLHPGQKIRVTGSLYQPQPASNPQAFDFQAYLKRQGGFAGLSGRQLTILNKGQPWGWWAVRQRIIRAQGRWLGDPYGPLVSAMVLGNRAVNLPFEVRDEFTQVGLAHALAASGFQTSLILSVVLVLARRLSNQQKFGLGTAALVSFACLSGFEPAVLRAVLMGIAGLIALVTERQSKPVSLLLVVATILLLLNPLWIWDLGFQFSFLATLGLIVTVPALIQRLDWLPPTIATLLAVPIAAFLWTLPLQLYTFGLVAPYSIIANVVTTPLISIITIGGFVSGLVGLIWPLMGSALAWLLYYPTYALTSLVHFFSQLPGNSVAIGTIDIWQLVVCYGLLCSIWLWPWWQRRWLLAGIVAIALVLIPTWQAQANTFRVTILATSSVPVMVIQEQGSTTLINAGDQLMAKLTILPFLQQQGVNQIESAIATDTNPGFERGWSEILQKLSVKNFHHIPSLAASPNYQPLLNALQTNQVAHRSFQGDDIISLASTHIKLIRIDPVALQLQIGSQTWLLLNDFKSTEQAAWITTADLPEVEVLWWSGRGLAASVVRSVQPKVLVSSSLINSDVIAQLQAENVQVYQTDRDGSVQWTSSRGLPQPLTQVIQLTASLTKSSQYS